MLTLDELATQPDRVLGMPREDCLRLIAVAAAMHAILVVRFSETTASADVGDALSTDEAARLLGIHSKTLANQASTRYKSFRLPNLSRRLAFSRRSIMALQQDRGLVLGSTRPVLLPAPRGNRRSRGGPAPHPIRRGEGGDS